MDTLASAPARVDLRRPPSHPHQKYRQSHSPVAVQPPEPRRRRSRASPHFAVAEITLWGEQVGAVAEDPSGTVIFEYAEGFRTSGLEISPIHLPLNTLGPRSFPELRRTASFAGLPGVLADALPDAFGNTVIKRYFEQRGTPDAALSPVQKLLYIGSRAMGALEFKPALDRGAADAIDQALEVAQLVQEARRVIEGDTSVAVPEMMQVGASAGGARAKGLILWNRAANRVRSAFANPEEGDEPWLIKFDGVTDGTGGPNIREDVRPGPFGRIEYAYAAMARAAGLDVTDSYLLHERDFAHFMTRRFDRIGTRPFQRLHMHSLGGLQHIDYNVRGAFSYEEYLRTIRRLGLDQRAVEQAFRRMVFNVAAANQDDHVKNIAFLMNPEGRWKLAPAFDVTFAKGNEWTRTHQMTVNGKDDDITRVDILTVGAMMDVSKDGADIIADVHAALDLWPEQARAVNVTPDWISHVATQFRRLG
jgi:serine/threonine-protein kinase HipA